MLHCEKLSSECDSIVKSGKDDRMGCENDMHGKCSGGCVSGDILSEGNREHVVCSIESENKSRNIDN